MPSSLKLKTYLVLPGTFLLGFIAATAITLVYSHGGDTNLIHGCVDNKGNLKVVGANESCGSKETALDWNKDSGSSIGNLPQICTGCPFNGLVESLFGTNLSNGIFWRSQFNDEDLNGFNFTNARLGGTDFAGADVSNSNFTGANLKYSGFDSTNFSNADFTNSDFTGSPLDTANLSNVAYSNTVCPDGTNSDNNGSTCQGHLTP